MSCHQTGVWIQQGSCSGLQWTCPCRCGRSRRCSPRTFLANETELRVPQGNHNGTRKHHGIQGTAPSTLLFKHLAQNTRATAKYTCWQNPCLSYFQDFCGNSTNQNTVFWVFHLCLKHKSPLLHDESATVSQFPYAHTESGLIPWHFPPMRHLVTLSTTKWVSLNPPPPIFPHFLCSQVPSLPSLFL